jgi:hypothetical protein
MSSKLVQGTPALGPSHAEWRKSRYSSEQGDNCVEVATMDRTIAVRDSKDPSGPILTFTVDEWRAFINGVKAGEFDIA